MYKLIASLHVEDSALECVAEITEIFLACITLILIYIISPGVFSSDLFCSFILYHFNFQLKKFHKTQMPAIVIRFSKHHSSLRHFHLISTKFYLAFMCFYILHLHFQHAIISVLQCRNPWNWQPACKFHLFIVFTFYVCVINVSYYCASVWNIMIWTTHATHPSNITGINIRSA